MVNNELKKAEAMKSDLKNYILGINEKLFFFNPLNAMHGTSDCKENL